MKDKLKGVLIADRRDRRARDGRRRDRRRHRRRATTTGDRRRPPITGSALDRASHAALKEAGGGKVTETEAGDEESYYEVEVTKADGSQVDVQLDRSFAVVGVRDREPDHDGRPRLAAGCHRASARAGLRRRAGVRARAARPARSRRASIVPGRSRDSVVAADASRSAARAASAADRASAAAASAAASAPSLRSFGFGGGPGAEAAQRVAEVARAPG